MAVRMGDTFQIRRQRHGRALETDRPWGRHSLSHHRTRYVEPSLVCPNDAILIYYFSRGALPFHWANLWPDDLVDSSLSSW